MQLHRAYGNDWEDVSPDKRNWWQTIASKTGGLVSPGNGISVLGGLLVVAGLILLSYQRNTELAVALLLAGRLADLADGLVADWTRTKSPVGEAMDAAIDKLEIILAVCVIGLLALMPIGVFIILAVHALYNVGVYIAAHFRQQRLHPSRSGKLAAATEWIVVALFVLHDGLKLSSGISLFTIWLAWLSFGLFTGLAIVSSYQYTKELFPDNEKS